jgi:hypothetical protein
MQAGAPARDNSRSTGAAPLAFVKSPNSAAGKSAAHRRPRERSCMSFETPVTATLPLIAHRLLLFRWRTERPAHYARLRSLRQFDNYPTTVPNRSSERGGRGSDFPQAKLELTPSCCIFDSISRLGDCIRLFCTLRMQTARVPGSSSISFRRAVTTNGKTRPAASTPTISH